MVSNFFLDYCFYANTMVTKNPGYCRQYAWLVLNAHAQVKGCLHLVDGENFIIRKVLVMKCERRHVT